MTSASNRRPQGYATWTGTPGDGGLVEKDTFTCNHCNSVHFVQPNCSVNDAPDLCRMCMRMICPRCADEMVQQGRGCVPFERRLESMERADQLRRQALGDYR